MGSNETLLTIRLDDEDRASLDALARAEKDTMSNVVRRLIRREAKRLGIVATKRKQSERGRR